MSLGKSWNKRSYIKRGFTFGLIIGIIIFFLSGIWMVFYTAKHIGEYRCPAIVDTTNCKWSDLWMYLLQAFVVIGLPALITSTIVGVFIGWSLSNKKVLTWEGVVSGIYVFIIVLLIIISLFSQQIKTTFFGGGKIEFISLGIYLLIAIVVGAIIGWIIGKIKSK